MRKIQLWLMDAEVQMMVIFPIFFPSQHPPGLRGRISWHMCMSLAVRWREVSNLDRVKVSKKVAELRFKSKAVTPKPVFLISDVYCGIPANYLCGVVKFSQTSPGGELYVYIWRLNIAKPLMMLVLGHRSNPHLTGLSYWIVFLIISAF